MKMWVWYIICIPCTSRITYYISLSHFISNHILLSCAWINANRIARL